MSAHELFDNYLRSNKKRRTVERFAILKQVEATTGHFSADMLCDALKSEGYPLSVTTVYATLELLVDCGLAIKQRFDSHATYYERAGLGEPSHHHLICRECGKIKEIRDPGLTTLIESRHYSAFTPRSFTLNIYGICSACARKAMRPKHPKN